MNRKTFVYRVSALMAVAVLTLAAYKVRPAYAAGLRDLHDLNQLRTAVNRDTSTPRIVLLLFPT